MFDRGAELMEWGTFTVTSVPEPAGVWLLATGLGLVLVGRVLHGRIQEIRADAAEPPRRDPPVDQDPNLQSSGRSNEQ